MKKLFTFITFTAITAITAALLLSISGCTHTLQGVGRDTEAAGRAIQDKAK